MKGLQKVMLRTPMTLFCRRLNPSYRGEDVLIKQPCWLLPGIAFVVVGFSLQTHPNAKIKKTISFLIGPSLLYSVGGSIHLILVKMSLLSSLAGYCRVLHLWLWGFRCRPIQCSLSFVSKS